MEKEDTLSEEERKEVKIEIKKAAQEKIVNQAKAIKNEYKKQVSTAITTAFGLVIALVWKDVVTALIPSIATPSFLEKFPLLISVYSAGIVTVLAVIGIILMSNWGKPKELKEK